MAKAQQDVTISPRLITAIDRTWSAIQQRHPDVPEVVITLGPGPGKGAQARPLRRGQVAAGRLPAAGNVHRGEGLAKGAREVLGTLLHEGAHGVASMREIQDTSRQGRFHNTRYRALAEELGLDVARAAAIGWSATAVPDATAALYRAELRRLDAALVAYRHAERGNGRGGRANRNNGVSARCGCGRRIRVAESVLDSGPSRAAFAAPTSSQALIRGGMMIPLPAGRPSSSGS